MKTRRLGNSDLDISVLGIGTWAIGGNIGQWGWGQQDEKDSIRVIQESVEQGINWIDTAPAYGLGNAEIVVGKAIKSMSEKPLIFTKCGFRWQPNTGELYGDLSKESVIKEVDESLQRLGIEQIDLYQIHRPLDEPQIEQAWLAMQELKQQGKLRYLGVSNFSVEQLELVNQLGDLISTQPGYSMINREVEQDVLPWCHANTVGTIHHSTMSNGLLTGTWSHDRKAKLDPSDWRHKSHQFQEPTFSHNLKLVEFLGAMAKDKGCSVAQLSIAWTLANPATTGSIIGARNIEQLNGLLPAANVILTEQDLFEIDAFQRSLAA